MRSYLCFLMMLFNAQLTRILQFFHAFLLFSFALTRDVFSNCFRVITVKLGLFELDTYLGRQKQKKRQQLLMHIL